MNIQQFQSRPDPNKQLAACEIDGQVFVNLRDLLDSVIEGLYTAPGYDPVVWMARLLQRAERGGIEY